MKPLIRIPLLELLRRVFFVIIFFISYLEVLIFKRDESVDYGNHIEELLKSIQQEDEQR